MAIAADLLCVLPELAVEMVEKCTSTDQGENALDWALVKVSMLMLENSGEMGAHRDVLDTARARITDP